MRLPAPALLTLVAVFLLAACGHDNTAPRQFATEPPAADDSIVIRALNVDAPLSSRKFEAGKPLPPPDGPDDVVLYDFGTASNLGGTPGKGGNVVMSGRSISDVGCTRAEPPCNGVFVGLSRIALGEMVDVNWRGSAYHYQVVSVCGVRTAQFSDSIYQRSDEEQLTLLTGAGTLGPSGFSIVLVVTARPAPVTAGEPCPQGTLPVLQG